MPSRVTVRTLHIDDLAECQANFPKPQNTPFRQQISRQSADGYSLYGLFAGGRLAAMIHINRQGPKDQAIKRDFPHPVIGNLYVLDEFRGQGFGKILLKHAEATLKAEHYQTVGLIASCQNIQAIRLYEKAGWQSVQQLPPRPGRDKHPRRYYAKELSP